MAGQKYQVSAVPFDTHDQYFRAGHRFGAEPTTVTVTDSPNGPYEITQEQFEQLRSDLRIKVQEGGTSTSGETQTSSAASETHEERRRRRE